MQTRKIFGPDDIGELVRKELSKKGYRIVKSPAIPNLEFVCEEKSNSQSRQNIGNQYSSVSDNQYGR